MKIDCSHRTTSGFTGVHLLIVLALGLCGLAVWQWTKETRLIGEVEVLQKATNSLTLKRDEYAKRLGEMQTDSAQIQKIRTELDAQIKTNLSTIRRLSNDVSHSNSRVLSFSNRAEAFIKGFQNATNELGRVQGKIDEVMAKVAKARESVAQFEKVAAERESFYQELKTRTDEYNKLIAKHDELIKEVNKYRSGEKK